jgi:hypothetical protein
VSASQYAISITELLFPALIKEYWDHKAKKEMQNYLNSKNIVSASQYALPITELLFPAQGGETGNVQSGGTERSTYVVEHPTRSFSRRDVPKLNYVYEDALLF